MHPCKFQRVSRLGSVNARYLVDARSSSGRQPNFAALNRGRHLCSTGRPSLWALAHILVLIYINDLIECCGAYSEVYVFAVDAKFYRHILSDDDNKTVQYALDALQKWSEVAVKP